jgi:hypothetical protein
MCFCEAERPAIFEPDGEPSHVFVKLLTGNARKQVLEVFNQDVVVVIVDSRDRDCVRY